MLREICSDFIKAVTSPVELGMLCIGLLLTVFVIVPVFSGCNTAQANPYKTLYEQQVVTTDSIKTVLMNQVNLVSLISNRKIDSLKSIETLLRNQIANFVCDTVSIIQYHHVTATYPYLFVPLNQRLTEIIDSLNRR